MSEPQDRIEELEQRLHTLEAAFLELNAKVNEVESRHDHEDTLRMEASERL